MLNDAEFKLVRNVALTYPAGVPSLAWGHGPMLYGAIPTFDDEDDDLDYKPAWEFAPEVLEEYG